MTAAATTGTYSAKVGASGRCCGMAAGSAGVGQLMWLPLAAVAVFPVVSAPQAPARFIPLLSGDGLSRF